MKKKVNSQKQSISGNVIRTIIREELQGIQANFDSKLSGFEKQVDQKFLAFEKQVDQKFVWFETKMDFKLEDLETRVDEKARQYRDEILASNDKLAKTLEDMREEITIGDFQTKEKLRDHEDRIKVLESA